MELPPQTAFRLALLRHARSGPAADGQKDFDRTLDDTGFAEADIIANILGESGFNPQRVLCSTAMRCRQTAEAVQRALADPVDIAYSDALFTGSVTVYRDMIAAQTDVTSLLLVGHNPMIEQLLHELATDAAPDGGYPTAGVAIIDFDSLPSGRHVTGGRYVGMITPKSRRLVP